MPTLVAKALAALGMAALARASCSHERSGQCVTPYTVTLVNLSFRQPLGRLFVMVHNAQVRPLYQQGQPASEELAMLAENGDPDPLVDRYSNHDGVLYAEALAGVPTAEQFSFSVYVNRDFPLVTLGAMALNTNDCFVAVNGSPVAPGDIFDLVGLDAGSEENNELCSSIPGPVCPQESGNARSFNGEGFVHVHRGFQGINEGSQRRLAKRERGVDGLPLSRGELAWSNPLARAVVRRGEAPARFQLSGPQ